MPSTRPQTPVAAAAAHAVIAARADVDELRSEFVRDGRTVAFDALGADVAERWLQRITQWSEWALVTRVQGQHRSFDAAGMAVLPVDKRTEFDELVARGAREGFQYLFERYPLYDLGRSGRLTDPVLSDIFSFLRSPELLAFVRSVTGDERIAFADGQITRYRRGHFLTLHDDRAEGMRRVAAYVLNLTPQWSADFGGQLQFVGSDGQIRTSISPCFNALTLFSVPQSHLVSAVAPFVTASRYAITGWFHEGEEPALPA